MGHDDDVVSILASVPGQCFIAAQTNSLLERAWKSGFDVLMLTVDTWQLGWRPTDIALANYVFYYAPGETGNELGKSDPVFMRKYGDAQATDSGKWIDSSVWHGKAHTWEKMPWLIREVPVLSLAVKACSNLLCTVEAHLRRPSIRDQRHPERCRCPAGARHWVRRHRRVKPRRPSGRRSGGEPGGPPGDCRSRRGQ